MKNTNLALESFTFGDVEKLPVFEMRRNPHSKKYAVFYKIGPSGEWKELAEMTGSMMGEPSTPILKRTRFKFIAENRMANAYGYAMGVEGRNATENNFLANAKADSSADFD